MQKIATKIIRSAPTTLCKSKQVYPTGSLLLALSLLFPAPEIETISKAPRQARKSW